VRLAEGGLVADEGSNDTDFESVAGFAGPTLAPAQDQGCHKERNGELQRGSPHASLLSTISPGAL
jgi:hypothetical protein